MAYNPININTLDLRKSTGIGVSIPFNQPWVFKTVYTTQEQVKYNLINFILTEPGERVFEPDFGLGLRKKLFEQITESTLEDIKVLFISRVEKQFPTLEITEFNITPYPDSNLINIAFSYNILNTRTSDQVSINF